MWAALIPIIAQQGLPLAEMLVAKWTSGNPPTIADFAELRALAQTTALDRTKARLAAAGIPLDSDKAKEILSLVS
jgi:hypothetical protein